MKAKSDPRIRIEANADPQLVDGYDSECSRTRTQGFLSFTNSPVVSDPDWIRIQWGPWIRIRIRNPDPDPGGQK